MPRQKPPSRSPLDPRLEQLSAIALALPETTRELSGSHATFRVRDKPFGYFLDDHHGDGIVAAVVKTARGEHLDWIRHDPGRFYLPAYLGARGWVGIRLDGGTLDWSEIGGFVDDSWRLVAPKRRRR